MQPVKAMRGELLRNIPRRTVLSVLMWILRNSSSTRNVQLERPTRGGPTKIASRNDKPEEVLIKPEQYLDGGYDNWLGFEGGKGEKAAVTCAWLQSESKTQFRLATCLNRWLPLGCVSQI